MLLERCRRCLSLELVDLENATNLKLNFISVNLESVALQVRLSYDVVISVRGGGAGGLQPPPVGKK